jgi:hypothetical protein
MKILLPLCVAALLLMSNPHLFSQATRVDVAREDFITAHEYQVFLNAAPLHEELRKEWHSSENARTEESIAKNNGVLYDEKMVTHLGEGARFLPIYRLGSPGNYSYELQKEEECEESAKKEFQEKPLFFVSIQEAECFCLWKNLPLYALRLSFPQMDRMLQTTQNSFYLSEGGAPSQQTMIEPEVIETMGALLEELLGTALLVARGAHLSLSKPNISYQSHTEAGKPDRYPVDLEVFHGQCVHKQLPSDFTARLTPSDFTASSLRSVLNMRVK